MRMRLPGYLLRLIGFTFLLGAIPVLIIGYVSYRISAGELESKAKSTRMQLLNQSRSEVENVLAKIDYGTILFAGSPTVNAMLMQPLTEEDYESYSELSGMLSKLGSGNTGIRAVSLVSFDYGWTIDRFRLGRLGESPGTERFSAYAAMPNASAWLADDSGSGAGLTFVRKLPLASGSAKPSGLLSAEVDLAGIVRQLSGAGRFHASAILDADLRILAGGQQLPSMRDSLSAMLQRYLSSREGEVEGDFQSDDAAAVGVAFTRSPYTGWYFVSVVAAKDLTRDARSIGWLTLCACVALLMLTAAIVWFGSRKMYNPVKKLYNALQAPDRSGSDGAEGNRLRIRNEFRAIENGVTRLMDAESAMKRQFEAVLPQVKELFAVKLFTGQLTRDDIEDKRRLLGNAHDGNELAVFALQCEQQHDVGLGTDGDMLMLAINKIIEETMPAGEYLLPVLLGRTQAVLMLRPPGAASAWKEELNRRGESIRRCVWERMGVHIGIGVSRPFAQLEDTMKAYVEALEALKHRIRFGPGTMVRYEEIEQSAPKPLAAYPDQLERQLLEAVRLTQTAWADDGLHAFFRYMIDRDVSPGEYLYMQFKLLFQLLELIRDEPSFQRDLFGRRAALERLSQPEPAEEKESWFREEVLHPVIALLARRIEDQHDGIASAAVQMIHEQVGAELSLEICASKLGFHPNHVSRVFKKELGITFSEYVAQYRLNLSKKWLRETDWKIGDISDKLNYNSPAAFIRYFRNMEGITPGEYRKRHGGAGHAAERGDGPPDAASVLS